jgi:serine/threonine protein kinase
VDGRVTLPKNTILGDSYRIERVIGSGGFGITYEAEDTNLGSKFALKEYYPFDFGNRDATMSVRPKSDAHKKTFEWGRSSFLQEARMLARFRHPSIVRITRVFEAHSTAYMVMELETGKNFESWLTDLGRPPTQHELDRISTPLLDALQLMHAENFLHRDIAPDNIIIRADGSPVLLDFGAARRAVGEMSRSLTGIVKAGYSPQEQYAAEGRLQGPWSDLYALGATLYRAVTGKPPEEATIRMTDDRTRPAVEFAERGYRANFLSAIDACLQPNRTKRPQSVAELRPVLLDNGPALKPDARSRATRKIEAGSARRSKAGLWFAMAAVLALVGGAYGGFEYVRRSSESGKEAKRLSEVATARKKTEEEAQEKARAREHARQEEVRRLAEAAVDRKRTEDEAQARIRADAEAKRQKEERAAIEKKAVEERARQQAETKQAATETALREHMSNTALVGDIIVAETIRRSSSECRRSCLARVECKAYEYRDIGSICYLYRRVVRQHNSIGSVSGRWD